MRFWIQVTLLLLVAFYAFKRGGLPERHVILILLGMLVASIANGAVSGGWTSYSSIPWFRIAIDGIGLALMLGVALHADRWWPLWVSSVQLLSVLAHLLRIVDADIPPLAYAIMDQWPFWIAIAITGLGTYLHDRRQRTGTPN